MTTFVRTPDRRLVGDAGVCRVMSARLLISIRPRINSEVELRLSVVATIGRRLEKMRFLISVRKPCENVFWRAAR